MQEDHDAGDDGQKHYTQRRRALSDEDIHAIKEAVFAAHACRFAVPVEEFNATWPVMRDLASSVHKAKRLSFNIIVTAAVIFVFGLVSRGLWGWFEEIQSRLPR